MHSDDKFWLGLWTIAGVTFLGLLHLSFSYHVTNNEQLLKATTCEQIMALTTSTERIALYCIGKDK